MQAPVFKRTSLTGLVGLALVIGLIASLALNVAMLARSDNDDAPLAAPRADSMLLAQQRRYYAAKEVRQDAVEAAASALVVPSTDLSPAQQHYVDRKSDQMDGITSRSSTLPTPSQQRYVDLKSDQMDAISAQVGASSTRIQFIQDNMLLPGAVPLVMSSAEILLRQQNLLPGDDLPLLPAYGEHGEPSY